MTIYKYYDEFNKLPDLAKSLIFEEAIKSSPGVRSALSNVWGTKSPIETIFSVAWEITRVGMESHDYLFLDYQKRIEAKSGAVYYADFYNNMTERYMDIFGKTFITKKIFVIECDGADYHTMTPAQIERDAFRDKDLQESGYTVIHFTGSEIYQNPYGCVRKVMKEILGSWEVCDGEIQNDTNSVLD